MQTAPATMKAMAATAFYSTPSPKRTEILVRIGRQFDPSWTAALDGNYSPNSFPFFHLLQKPTVSIGA